MSLQNGAINSALLFPAAGTPGAQLRFGSAHRWAKVRYEVHRRYGWWPSLTSPGDAYRPLETQRRIFLQRYSLADSGWRGAGHIKPYQGRTYYIRTNPVTGRPYAVAATPGTSNHGEGKAVDVAGLTSMILTRWGQFADVATECGFSNAEGRSIGEAWHWVDQLDPDDALDDSTPEPKEPEPEEEDEMSAADLEAIHERFTNIENILAGVPGQSDGIRGDVQAIPWPTPLVLFYWTGDGSAYEANIPAGTVRRIGDPTTLVDRITVLDRTEVSWVWWKGSPEASAVDNRDAFGRLV